MFALIIMVGATVYEYDHLRYDDLQTCEYHRKIIQETFEDINRKKLQVFCKFEIISKK